ncbi:MAG TPA: hypothetical protein VED01_20465 [Burkholderiales bacterium]|nr:hypothetical protein [Burkholderiales bacterium]
MRKYLVTLAALGLCTSVLAQSVISDGTGSSVSAGSAGATITSPDGSSVSAGRRGAIITSPEAGNAGSVILDNQSSVTSSTTTDGAGATTNSIAGRTGSMCSAVYQGERCEIACQAPQVAQCGKAENASQPSCFCQ